MQFIPTTWSAVGVDADGDGQRDPQDINDAALAAAAYLCSGPYDLGNEAGRRARPSSVPDVNDGGRASREDEPEAKPQPPAVEEAPVSPLEQVQDEVDGTLEKVAEPLPTPVGDPADQVLTRIQASTRCTMDGVSRLDLLAWNQCVNDMMR